MWSNVPDIFFGGKYESWISSKCALATMKILKSQAINMYTSMVLVLFGVGLFVCLFVLIHSRAI